MDQTLIQAATISILTERINNLQSTMAELQALVRKVEGDLQTYTNATKSLAEQLVHDTKVRNEFHPSISEDGAKRYSREPNHVRRRWQEWKTQYESGQKLNEIARKWGVHHASIRYARSMDWVPDTIKKQKGKQYDNHNDNATNHRTDRSVRGSHQQTKQRREGSGISSADTQNLLRNHGKLGLRRKSLGNQSVRRGKTKLGCV